MILELVETVHSVRLPNSHGQVRRAFIGEIEAFEDGAWRAQAQTFPEPWHG